MELVCPAASMPPPLPILWITEFQGCFLLLIFIQDMIRCCYAASTSHQLNIHWLCPFPPTLSFAYPVWSVLWHQSFYLHLLFPKVAMCEESTFYLLEQRYCFLWSAVLRSHVGIRLVLRKTWIKRGCDPLFILVGRYSREAFVKANNRDCRAVLRVGR